MYDLLLKGGTVLDPAQDVHKRLDVGITGDRITRLESSIDTAAAARVIDVSGKYVLPGLIDIHCHPYTVGRNRLHPDMVGVQGGVTTAAAAGDPGPDNFQDFCDFVISQAQTRIYCLIYIFRDHGPAATSKRSKTTSDGWDMDVEGVIKTAREFPGVVKGIKVQLSNREYHAIGLKHIKEAKVASRELGLPVLMHIADTGPRDLEPTPPEVVGQAVSMMDPGDTITHIFTPLTGSSLDREGKVLPELFEAQQRGVFMDAACGINNFGWKQADMVLAQGLIPDCISSDLQLQFNPVRGLLEYTAFYLELGFSLDDVVRMTTITPARFLRIEDRAGSLALGRDADVSVVEVVEGRWELTDATGVSRIGSKALVPVVTVKGGRVFEPGEGIHSWGWGPPTAVEAGAIADN